MTGVAAAAPRRLVPGALHLALLGAAALAWAVTLAWALSTDGGAMPGTMGMGLAAFVLMWAVMMAAMMLPSVWPFAAVYARTVTTHRLPRLVTLAAGYVTAWAATGVVAYLLASVFGDLAIDRPGVAHAAAVATFAAAGVYQLTPLKQRCLSHCRSPLAHLFHYASFRGAARDARAGLSHGSFCLGCCWALMLLLVAFGVMNVAAMVGLALVIGIEKVWRHGARFARVVGVAALVYAAALVADPSLAPGLDPAAAHSPMSGTDMKTEMDTRLDDRMGDQMGDQVDDAPRPMPTTMAPHR